MFTRINELMIQPDVFHKQEMTSLKFSDIDKKKSERSEEKCLIVNIFRYKTNGWQEYQYLIFVNIFQGNILILIHKF